jgi:protein-L-isoaspartate(D-aspartate) O-methyltransferase
MTPDIDFEQARFNMIEQQIRTWDVSDQKVLDLLGLIHREDFVPEGFRQLALADTNIPLANSQAMMTPKLEARLLQAVAIQEEDRVLEIGTGSAYLTALLAKSAQHIDSIDIFENFGDEAKIKLKNYNIDNVSLSSADILSSWKNKLQYDVIVVTGSVLALDSNLQQQLTVGGRLFAIVGESPVMEARLITHMNDGQFNSEILFETELPALVGVHEPSSFEL